MQLVLTIPRRYETFTKFLTLILGKPQRAIYQSEVKRVLFPKSLQSVVKREIRLWNKLLQENNPGTNFITTTTRRNPHSGRRNEVLFKIPTELEVVVSESATWVYIKEGGTKDEKGKQEADKEIQSRKLNSDDMESKRRKEQSTPSSV